MALPKGMRTLLGSSPWINSDCCAAFQIVLIDAPEKPRPHVEATYSNLPLPLLTSQNVTSVCQSFGWLTRVASVTSSNRKFAVEFSAAGTLTSDFTVMAWVNPADADGKGRVFGSAPWAPGAGWAWGTNASQLELTTWGVVDYTESDSLLEVGQWNHAAVVMDEDFATHLYVNGEFVGTETHSRGGGATDNNFYIGFGCCDGEHFNGRLDEVGVFEGSLTPDQIKNAMLGGVADFNEVAVALPFAVGARGWRDWKSGGQRFARKQSSQQPRRRSRPWLRAIVVRGREPR